MTERNTGWKPIESYAAIGNLRTTALVGRDGSLDWLCLPDLDSASVFAGLLDPQRGGYFSIRPADAGEGEQAYVPQTNVVETSFETAGGRLVVTDFMPLEGSLDGAGSSSRTQPAIYRIVRAEGGAVDVDVAWAPRLDYGRPPTRIESGQSGFVASAGEDSLLLTGLDEGDVRMEQDHVGPVLRGRFQLEAGQRRLLVTRWGSDGPAATLDDGERRLAATIESWRSWVNKPQVAERDWSGDHRDLIIRSELALKLLTYADTGAIAAAATTSLPEEIGGVRNWDYRYSWIRDSALAAQALFAMGHRSDAEEFVKWAERTVRNHADDDEFMHIVYSLRGSTELPERELPNLAGYRQSAPVRIGNGAAGQLQLDIYGELLSAAYEIIRLGGSLPDDVMEFLPRVADEACARWQEADYGIWELRNAPFHFVYSKAMAWMALERAIRMARNDHIRGDVERWKRTAGEIRDEVLDRGFSEELNAFKQTYDRAVPDVSNILIPMMELLPFKDPRVQGTIDATLKHLTENGLVYRYHADDGIAGGEGGWVICTFWLVDALALSGRIDEARELFENLAARANHVGLFSEQIDPRSGEFLGNFPQAFSHIGLINSSLYLAHVEGREIPVPGLIGTDEHRRNGHLE